MKTVTLVKFKDELFPRSGADFQLLKSCHVTVFRIPENLLGYLQSTLLKKVNVKIVDFPSVYQAGLLAFKDSTLDPLGIKSKFQKNIILMSYQKELIEDVNISCLKLTSALGKFGFKIVRENKPNPTAPDTHFLTRLEVVADPDINPSYYFGDFMSDFVEHAVINLSGVARISFRARPSKLNPGKTTFSLEFQDKFGDEWVAAFSRAFDLNHLDRDEVSRLVNQLISMSNAAEHYAPPKKQPTKQIR